SSRTCPPAMSAITVSRRSSFCPTIRRASSASSVCASSVTRVASTRGSSAIMILPGGSLFGTGSGQLTELREVLADEVALTARNEALVGRVQRGLLVGLDHLAVGAERHVLARSQGGGIVLRLAGHRLARHVDALGALGTRAAPPS